MKLNETPIRTSRNYNINNITIENIELPEKIEPFENVSITGIEYTNNTNTTNLTYGLSEILQQQVKESSNQKIKMQIKNNENAQIDFKFDKQNIELVENIEIIAQENSRWSNNNKIRGSRKHTSLPQWNNKCNSKEKLKPKYNTSKLNRYKLKQLPINPKHTRRECQNNILDNRLWWKEQHNKLLFKLNRKLFRK